MHSLKAHHAIVGTIVSIAAIWANAQNNASRTELKRADLTGASGMEVIESIVEFKPGETIPAHTHHGIESAYVLQGATLQQPGKAPRVIPTGTPLMNLRDAVHGGDKIVGDTSYKLYTVHIVDKGKPLYEPAEK